MENVYLIGSFAGVVGVFLTISFTKRKINKNRNVAQNALESLNGVLLDAYGIEQPLTSPDGQFTSQVKRLPPHVEQAVFKVFTALDNVK